MPGLDVRVLDEQVLRRPQRLAALNHARAALVHSDAPADSVARLAATAVASAIALVTLVSTDRLYVLGNHGAPGAVDRAADVPLAASCCAHVVSGDRPVTVVDDPAMLRYWSVEHLSYLGVPIHSPDGETVGAVCAVDTVPRRWTDADVRAMTAAAGVVEHMLREPAVSGTADPAAWFLPGLLDSLEVTVARVLSRTRTVEEAGRRVLEAIGTTQGWRHAEFWLAHAVGTGMRPAATWTATGHDLTGFVPRSLAARQGLAGTAWAEERPIWYAAGAPTGLLDPDQLARHGLRTAVAVPVRSPERAFGVLTFFAEPDHSREESLLTVLAGLAAHVGQYVERSRTEELTKELARAKDEFIALVGHEMRTPLTSVSAYTELLLTDDAIPPHEQREFLGIIHRNAETLRVIIEDLLDLAGLESGYVTIRSDAIDLAAIVEEAVRDIQPAATEKDLTVTAYLDVAAAPMIGDAARLRQVVDHLLDNAVTYTMAGGTVRVGLADEDAAYRLTVADTGIGIPPAERQQLFQRFFRASNTRSRGIPGTGLGLTISRTILERHAGTISVAETPEPGTTFEIRLPSAD